MYLDDDSVVDFDVKAELERIPCYKSRYDQALFKAVKFKNKRIYWNDQSDFLCGSNSGSWPSSKSGLGLAINIPFNRHCRI